MAGEPVHERDVEWDVTERGEIEFRRKRLGDAAGGDQLGASLYEVPPGKRTWPYHFHAANEESIHVLAGAGTLRVGGTEHPLEPGDYVALPTGEEYAHQVHNTGEEPLRFLMSSTMCDPDVTVYPEMDKIGVYAGSAPGGDPDERVVAGYWPRDGDVDYWE